MTVGVGLDEAGINDDRDMLQEMRLVLRLHRQPGIETRKPTANEVFAMATTGGGATTPFKGSIGRLDPGMWADMVLIDWNAVAFPYLEAGVPVVDALVHLARTRHVSEVRVGGEAVYRHGRFTGVDRDAILAEIALRLARPLTAAEEERRRLSARLEGPIRDFYRDYYDSRAIGRITRAMPTSPPDRAAAISGSSQSRDKMILDCGRPAMDDYPSR